MKIEKGLAGVAGEYFVAAELSRRGYIASVTLRNTRGMDILATNSEASRSITIQCKTAQTSQRGWILNEKCEKFISARHFYVFVTLRSNTERPGYHIVPSRIVAKYTKQEHSAWKKKRRRDGKKHGYSAVRIFADRDNEYLERWDLLGL